jgi:hypothetical protein
MPLILASHKITGNSAQFTIDGRYQLIQSRFITFPPRYQKLGYLRRFRGRIRHKFISYEGNFPFILPYAAKHPEVFEIQHVLIFWPFPSLYLSQKQGSGELGQSVHTEAFYVARISHYIRKTNIDRLDRPFDDKRGDRKRYGDFVDGI